MTHAPLSADALDMAVAARRRRVLGYGGASAIALAVVVVLSIGRGAIDIPPDRVLAALLAAMAGTPDPSVARDVLVIWNVRLPRTILAVTIGAALGLSGAVMQGLFRNPLADPGLVGVSAGAALAAAATIVLGERFLVPIFGFVPFFALPAGAFFGGLAGTLILYAIATRQGRTSIATMLLAGIALGALAGALSGFLAYLSDDRQLRDITFWSLGSLGGATWTKAFTLVAVVAVLVAAAAFLARGLNALVLGEAEAFHLGLPVQFLKSCCIVLVALAVGACVATAGVIGFIGIVAPHLVRLTAGSDHRVLLPLCAVVGAVLLTAADVIARTIAAPAELPIGILTAAIGAPFFLWLLLRRDRTLDG
jgi:iron complex transport system permease protein